LIPFAWPPPGKVVAPLLPLQHDGSSCPGMIRGTGHARS
jgi:hypothetical protein